MSQFLAVIPVKTGIQEECALNHRFQVKPGMTQNTYQAKI